MSEPIGFYSSFSSWYLAIAIPFDINSCNYLTNLILLIGHHKTLFIYSFILLTQITTSFTFIICQHDHASKSQTFRPHMIQLVLMVHSFSDVVSVG